MLYRKNFFMRILCLLQSIFVITSSSICQFHDDDILCKSFEYSHYNISSLEPHLILQSIPVLHLINGYYLGALPDNISKLVIEDYPYPSFPSPFSSSSSLNSLVIEHTFLNRFPSWLCQYNGNLTSIEIDFSNLEQIIDHDLYLCYHLHTLRISNSLLQQFFTPSLNSLSIQSLFLHHNHIKSISSHSDLDLDRFVQLRFLDLSYNYLQSIYSQSFNRTSLLTTLDLSSNQLIMFQINDTKHFFSLEILDLQENLHLQLNTNWYSYLPHLRKIYFPYAHFCCHSKIDLQTLHRQRSKRMIFNETSLDLFDKYPPNIQRMDSITFRSEQVCSPLPDEMTPCESLFSSTFIRSIFLIIVLISVGANLAALIINVVRLIILAYNRWSISTILSSNLALADFISSIYLVLIGIIDIRFDKDFYHHTQLWTMTPLCTFTGFIYIFGIQSSIYALTLLTFERFYTILFSFKRQTPWPTKFTLLSITFGWLISLFIASLPLININNFHANSLCVPFRIETLFDRIYLSLLIIFDLFSLGIIITCNGLICFNFSKSHVHTSNDARATVKIFTLVMAICISRIPLIIFIFLALIMHPSYSKNTNLHFHDIKLAILFLQPVSSIFNPFMYSSLSTLKWTTTSSGFERPKPARKSRKSSRSHSQSEHGYYPLRMMSISSLDYRCSSLPNTP